MRTFAKKVLILAAMSAGTMMVSNAQVVYWNGLGRALVTGSYLNGNVLNQSVDNTDPLNPVTVQNKDTKSARKSTDGYTIFDLGINAQPNETLRASATLRLINSFGGFYGDGSQFVFRQLRLDGIIGKKVKYEIGDIDLELSKYTLFNSNEIYNSFESDILAQRRSVVEYENFNFGNKWRLQGAHAETSLRFKSGIEKIGIRAFATRNRRYTPSISPDRYMLGGRVELVQSRIFQLGVNSVYLFDAVGSVSSAGITNKNTVNTVDWKLNAFTDKFDFSFYGEAGASNNTYSVSERDTISANDYFYDLGVSAKYKPLLLKVFGNYRYVGADFFSSGAQTRRINDFGYGGPNGANTLGLFGQFDNNTTQRGTQDMGGATLLDYVSDQNLRNLNLRNALMTYNPAYNNITPYGQATANRKGVTVGATVGSSEKVVRAELIADLLTEVTPVGDTTGLRKFTGVKGGAQVNIHKLLRFEKDIIFSVGARYEQTKRDGSAPVDFKSTLIDLGLTVEVVKNLDVLGGVKTINAKGNEFIYTRNVYNQIDTALTFENFNLDQSQLVFSAGARYRFSKNTYFTVNYLTQQVKFADDASRRNYNINQIFFNYTMIF